MDIRTKIMAMLDPFEGMAAIARDPDVDIAVRARMLAELGSYCWAKPQSEVHVTGDFSPPMQPPALVIRFEDGLAPGAAPERDG